jgi:CRISPR type III-B/RAMP module RAMP protein Cmr6
MQPNASSEHTASHFDRICKIEAGPSYQRAYARWRDIWVQETKQQRAAVRPLRIQHRLLIGLSNPSLWDTSITLNPTYGTPVVPGSACKGVARHFARSHLQIEVGGRKGLAQELADALFGRHDDMGEVCFQDAWWVPGSAPSPKSNRPFVREVVTPHHKQFLDSKGDVPATPFDSPVPIPQIAANGSFFFVVTGSAVWAEHALDILQIALEMEGIGARTPEYGCITPLS